MSSSREKRSSSLFQFLSKKKGKKSPEEENEIDLDESPHVVVRDKTTHRRKRTGSGSPSRLSAILSRKSNKRKMTKMHKSADDISKVKFVKDKDDSFEKKEELPIPEEISSDTVERAASMEYDSMDYSSSPSFRKKKERKERQRNGKARNRTGSIKREASSDAEVSEYYSQKSPISRRLSVLIPKRSPKPKKSPIAGSSAKSSRSLTADEIKAISIMTDGSTTHDTDYMTEDEMKEVEDILNKLDHPRVLSNKELLMYHSEVEENIQGCLTTDNNSQYVNSSVLDAVLLLEKRRKKESYRLLNENKYDLVEEIVPNVEDEFSLSASTSTSEQILDISELTASFKNEPSEADFITDSLNLSISEENDFDFTTNFIMPEEMIPTVVDKEIVEENIDIDNILNTKDILEAENNDSTDDDRQIFDIYDEESDSCSSDKLIVPKENTVDSGTTCTLTSNSKENNSISENTTEESIYLDAVRMDSSKDGDIEDVSIGPSILLENTIQEIIKEENHELEKEESISKNNNESKNNGKETKEENNEILSEKTEEEEDESTDEFELKKRQGQIEGDERRKVMIKSKALSSLKLKDAIDEVVRATGSKRSSRMKLGGAVEYCWNCKKVVYQMERVFAFGKAWHRSCYRCYQCNKVLPPLSRYEVNNLPHCIQHYNLYYNIH